MPDALPIIADARHLPPDRPLSRLLGRTLARPSPGLPADVPVPVMVEAVRADERTVGAVVGRTATGQYVTLTARHPLTGTVLTVLFRPGDARAVGLALIDQADACDATPRGGQG